MAMRPGAAQQGSGPVGRAEEQGGRGSKARTNRKVSQDPAAPCTEGTVPAMQTSPNLPRSPRAGRSTRSRGVRRRGPGRCHPRALGRYQSQAAAAASWSRRQPPRRRRLGEGQLPLIGTLNARYLRHERTLRRHPSRRRSGRCGGVLRHAAKIGLETMKHLITDTSRLIAGASGVPRADLTRFLASAEAEVAHRYRNLALCLALACTSEKHGDATEIAKRFPALKARTPGRHRARAYGDDEIALLGLWAWHMAHGDANGRRAAAVYALTITGLTPSETTRVRRHDVLLEAGALTIAAPASSNWTPTRPPCSPGTSTRTPWPAVSG